MMLDKIEIIKLVLYDVEEIEYEQLVKKIPEMENFPKYPDFLRDSYAAYNIDKGLIYLDDVSGPERNNKDLLNQIKETAYDLRLGKQYLIGEKIYNLDIDSNPILRIPPHDVAVVMTYEYLRIPQKVVGTFQLDLNFILKGLMLANGAQIKPGYEGKLACVLFNLTNKPILLKYKEDFAKISFLELKNHTVYGGIHQGKANLHEFIREWMPTSGLADINEKLEKYHNELETHKKDIDDKIRNAMIIILTIISIVLAIYGIFGASNSLPGIN